MEEKDLRLLANQLMKPEGDRGIEIANMMNESNQGMTINSIENLSLTENDVILEIGPGNAGHLNYLFSKVQKLRYFGIDISELMVSEASRINCSQIENESASFTLYDGENIPFESNYFDRIFTVNTIYFWSNPILFIQEISRVLKHNGRFSLTFAEASFMEKLPFTKFNFNLFSVEKLQEIIKDSNLTIASIDNQKEMIHSKTGELVERKFVTVLLKKN